MVTAGRLSDLSPRFTSLSTSKSLLPRLRDLCMSAGAGASLRPQMKLIAAISLAGLRVCSGKLEPVEDFDPTDLLADAKSRCPNIDPPAKAIMSPLPLLPPNEEHPELEAASSEVIRCPQGWEALSAFCLTLSNVLPYTQCPDDRSRFKKGVASDMSVATAGVCEVVENTGAILTCPPGLKLFMDTPHENIAAEATWKCLGFRSQRNNSTDVSCEMGAELDLDGKRCLEPIEMAPDVGCPGTFKLGTKPVNSYAFRGRKYVECARVRVFKGKLWCPNGFTIAGDPFEDIQFGDYISEPFQEQRLQELNVTHFEIPTCAMALSVHSSRCTKYRCNSEFLKEVEATVRHWGFYKLEGDPDIVARAAIPNNKNLRFTKSGARRW